MRAIIFTSADSGPLDGGFPEPEALPGLELLELVSAGLYQVVRGLASGKHYGDIPVPYTAYPFDRIDEAWAHTARTRAVVVPG